MQKVKTKSALLKSLCAGILFSIVLGASELNAYAQQPFSVEQVISLLEKKVPEADIIKQIEQYKVSFELTNENVRALIRAGASDRLLKVAENNPYQELLITSPKNGEDAGSVLTVEGRSKKFPGKHLWAFAQKKGLSVWWPQGGEIEIGENGEWMQSVFIGEPHDVGFKFEVVAIWVSESINKDLIVYLQSGEKTGRYPGMRLPEGSPRAQVTVRKTTP
jgi:hypothetical protein